MEFSCWQKETITADECPFVAAGDHPLLFDRRQRFLRHCVNCSTCLQSLAHVTPGDGVDAALPPLLIEALCLHQERVRALERHIATRDRELAFLHDVGQVLQTSVDRDEVIAMALTAITSGKGFGLNRAILLLVDEANERLVGHLAVGPREAEEAGRIWHEVESLDYSLIEMGERFFREKMASEREKFGPLLECLTTPLAQRDHPFVRVLDARTPYQIDDLFAEPGLDREQAEDLGVQQLILVPLISRDRRIGLLLADNCINRRPLTAGDLHSLETFALPVSFAIERAALYARLQQELGRVLEAHARLQQQQDIIVRMERLALLGRLAADLAHSIRNPLLIIGGYARTLLREAPPGDPRRDYLESMVRESRRLEETLQDVFSHTEELHPTFGLWDINRLLAEVAGEMRDDLALGRVECRLDLAPLLPAVRVDFRKMHHCLRCILNRAFEGSLAGETIVIHSERRQDELLVHIRDGGPTLTPEEIATIHAPIDPAAGDRHLFGLSLCAQTLREHRARFLIESDSVRGTHYLIGLPIPEEA
ncbi:MAG: hypothetical protein A2091_00075 [Desulfuromonadales bacterium GWD2_61_12]|nr:MAG: hypothetical protein A2005_11015 [Desulfuromonadales bacterium GWC2_61_20]OGR36202.1 MAG: hypothetical protein A2091_00075 [Desulfuromonadales bacterium GWD2_61_12]HBT84074.1 histidine kinase [Desulfuromonas sp.]